MRNYKKGILIIIILEFLLVYLIFAVYYRSIVTPFFERAFWFLPIIAIVPSFLLAMLVTVLFYKEGRENKIQFYCQLSGLILMVCLCYYTFGQQLINQWQNDSDNNHLSIEDSPKELERALQVLKNQFNSTTKIKLNSYWVSNEDTEAIKNRNAFYAIYFTYYLNADSSKEYFSKLVPDKTTYKVEVLNGHPEFNEKISNWRRVVDEALQEEENEHNEN